MGGYSGGFVREGGGNFVRGYGGMVVRIVGRSFGRVCGGRLCRERWVKDCVCGDGR